MQQRTVSFTYASLLRIVGTCFLLYGLYLIVGALTAQSWDSQNPGPAIFTDTNDFLHYLFFGGILWGAHAIVPGISYGVAVARVNAWLTPGPLLWVGLGLVCLSLTARRVLVAFEGLQIALWMNSAALWIPILWLPWALDRTNRGPNSFWPWPPFQPMFLVTLALSLVLLALYLPVTHGLRSLMGPQDERNAHPIDSTASHLAPSQRSWLFNQLIRAIHPAETGARSGATDIIVCLGDVRRRHATDRIAGRVPARHQGARRPCVSGYPDIRQ